MSRRVAITGLSALSPNGVGVSAYWDALFAGRSGVDRLTLIDPQHHRHDCGGEVTDFDPSAYFTPRQVRRVGRAVQLALVATQMAWDDAAFAPGTPAPERLGLITGAAGPMMDRIEEDVTEVYAEPGYTKLSPFTIARQLPHVHTTDAYARMDPAPGYTMTVSMACCSGSNAMALGAERIGSGELDVVLCGAGDSIFARGIFTAFEATRMMYKTRRAPEQIMRPFNIDRDGGVLSEGAGSVVLESLEHARARGARVYAQWLGAAATPPERATPKDEPARIGLRRSMRAALHAAGLAPEDVDYVSAHATSAPDTDAEEARALWDVFGDRTPRMPVSSVKSMIGNPVGAVGPLQVAALCGSFARGLVPPTINVTERDPECALDVVPNHARRNRIRTGMINIHGLDGANTTLLLGAPADGAADTRASS